MRLAVQGTKRATYHNGPSPCPIHLPSNFWEAPMRREQFKNPWETPALERWAHQRRLSLHQAGEGSVREEKDFIATSDEVLRICFSSKNSNKAVFLLPLQVPYFETRKWQYRLWPACVVSGSRGLFLCFENETVHGSEMESRPRFVSEAISHVPQRGL